MKDTTRVKIGKHALMLGGREVPLVSGAVHYWRLERGLWDRLLDAVVGMGFRVVETYIPWSAHEREWGGFDFGAGRPNRDLEAFIRLCGDKGLYLVVRPGPHINAEITYFGYPPRVLKDPECLSLALDGKPHFLPVPPRMFPVPSYASTKFLGEVEAWFDAVLPIVKSHLYPEGPIIAIQADNECSHFFYTSPFTFDCSPDSRRQYRDFLKVRYGDVEALNASHLTRYRDFSEVEPPPTFDGDQPEDLPRHLDWVRYTEEYLRLALGRIRRMYEVRGVSGIPVFHNAPSSPLHPPFNTEEMEGVIDIEGFDLYPMAGPGYYRILKTWSLAVSAGSRLPYIPEFSSGGWPYFLPITLADQRFTTWVGWMHGIKAINFYMLVERERWYGSPVSRDGRIRPEIYEFFRTFNRALEKGRLHRLERHNPICLLSQRDYRRHQATTTVWEPISSILFDGTGLSAEVMCLEEATGFSQCIPIANDLLFNNYFAALERASLPFTVADSGIDAGRLAGYSLVVAPTFDYLEDGVQSRLVDFVTDGGTLLVGPLLPERDDRMQACRLMAGAALKKTAAVKIGGESLQCWRLGKGRLYLWESTPTEETLAGEDLDRTAAVLGALAGKAGVEAPYSPDDSAVDTAYHRDPDDAGRGVLYVANPTSKARKICVTVRGGEHFFNLLEEKTVKAGKKGLSLSLEPFTIELFEVRR